MKKSTLALSVAAALGGFGFVGSAFAIVTMADPVGQLAIAASATVPVARAAIPAGTQLVRNGDGIGHQLVIPYFSTQNDNVTLFEITNHDRTSAKVVKVRFRGAGNSDDLYDFTLLLSPGDKWSAAVSKDAATGASKLFSADTSCVLPVSAKNSTFSTLRVDPTPASGDSINQTREGYVEILNMADVNPGNALFNTIKHTATGINLANTAPACDGTVLETNLGTDVADTGAAAAKFMTEPTGNLSANWILLNQTSIAAWSGQATALQARDAGGAPATGSVVFWPQKDVALALALSADYTSDPLLTGAVPIVTPKQYDLPDMSTRYVTGDTAVIRANLSTAQLAVKTLNHSFAVGQGIDASTDVVFSQPTRRYSVAMNYTTNTRVFTALAGNFYTALNTQVSGRQVCVNNLTLPNIQGVFDADESTPGSIPGTFVISPQPAGSTTTFLVCGEASIGSINNGGAATTKALQGNVARTDATFSSVWQAGWATWDITAAGGNANGLPLIADAFLRVRNGAQNYGFRWPATVTR